jgi:hypothetical protein
VTAWCVFGADTGYGSAALCICFVCNPESTADDSRYYRAHITTKMAGTVMAGGDQDSRMAAL